MKVMDFINTIDNINYSFSPCGPHIFNGVLYYKQRTLTRILKIGQTKALIHQMVEDLRVSLA